MPDLSQSHDAVNLRRKLNGMMVRLATRQDSEPLAKFTRHSKNPTTQADRYDPHRNTKSGNRLGLDYLEVKREIKDELNQVDLFY